MIAGHNACIEMGLMRLGSVAVARLFDLDARRQIGVAAKNGRGECWN